MNIYYLGGTDNLTTSFNNETLLIGGAALSLKEVIL
jgi:hypothetical protein